MMNKKLIYNLFFLLILSNCSLYDEPACVDKDFGKSELFASTRKMFDIYKDKKKAIFKDSLGNRDTFTIVYENYFDRSAEWTGIQNCRAENFYLFERVKVKFSSNKKITFFEIGANYYREEITNLKSNRIDFFRCISPEGITTPFVSYNFEIKSEGEKLPKEEKLLLNRFYSTIIPQEIIHNYYFTEEECLVAIKLPDLGNRLMVLEKLE